MLACFDIVMQISSMHDPEWLKGYNRNYGFSSVLGRKESGSSISVSYPDPNVRNDDQSLSARQFERRFSTHEIYMD